MKSIVGFAAIVGALATSPALAQASYSNLYVFGDSLVDSGNAFLATGGAEAPPANGYFFGRFSNGYNFADYLSLDLVGTPTSPGLIGGNNFGVGGATTATIPGAQSPSFLQQVGLYNQVVGQPIASDALVLLTFGGNDVRRTISTGGPVDFSTAGQEFGTGLASLYALGARNFLITGSPDIALLPRSVSDAGAVPGRLDELTFRSQQINATLSGVSSAFAAQTGADVTYFDLFGFEQTLRADPTSFGLPSNLNLTDPCQIIGGGVPQFNNCAGSIYFDAIHPTTSIHRIIASAMGAQLGAVPEPATWLMMILGFGFVGGSLRTARRKVALPA
jgi:phospholipase/lecithinase/hemolysin